jgi:Mg-chelatase subunit ChlD
MRRSAIALLLFGAASLARGEVAFVSPKPETQVLGPVTIEVVTDAPRIDRVEFSVDGRFAGYAREAPFRIVHDFGDSLDAHTIAARVSFDGYRKHETATLRTGALVTEESIDVDLVEVPLRIRFRGAAVKPADLEIRENGIVQQVSEVIAERPPTDFVFVVDRSLSMSGPKIESSVEALDAAQALLRAGDRASVVFFNHNVSRAITPGELEPDSAIPSGGTSLRDALLSIAPARRTIAIVISDGSDRNSFASEAVALQELSRSRITLFALMLGSGNANGFLKKLAGRTGGRVFSSSPERIEGDLKALFDDINGRHTAVYQSRGTAKGWRTITVASKRGGLGVTSPRKGYFAR